MVGTFKISYECIERDEEGDSSPRICLKWPKMLPIYYPIPLSQSSLSFLGLLDRVFPNTCMVASVSHRKNQRGRCSPQHASPPLCANNNTGKLSHDTNYRAPVCKGHRRINGRSCVCRVISCNLSGCQSPETKGELCSVCLTCSISQIENLPLIKILLCVFC